MTDYTWPTTVIPSSTTWKLIANTAAYVSPLAGTTRTLGRGGDRWGATLTCNNLTGDKRATLTAFLARLCGQTHRVLLKDHAYSRRGTQSADVLVNGGSQTGYSLITDGGTSAKTLLVGDWISVGYQLYMVVADATYNGSGQATLTLNRPLLSSPADNATVAVATPTGRFLLTDNTVQWTNEPGGSNGVISSMTVDFIEDIIP